MENETSVAGASGGDQTPAPSILDTWDHDDKMITPQTEEAAAADEPEEVEAAPEADEAPEATPERSEDDNSPEPDDPKHRLRDGEEVPLGELKKVYGTRKEIEAAKAALEAKEAQFQQTIAAVRQQEQFIAQQMPMVLNTLRQTIPPPPDPAMKADDPIQYFMQKDAHEEGVRQHQRALAAHQALTQQQTAAQQEALRLHTEKEHKRLLERMPELQDVKTRQKFTAELQDHVLAYGFTVDEYNQTNDSRLIELAADAMRWRKLQANKPKAIEKAKDAPPVVQAPARRRSTAEVQAQGVREQLSRLAKTGSARDAEAFLSRFE